MRKVSLNLLLLSLPVLAFYVLIFGQRWIPVHDTFFSFTWNQFLYTNIANGEIPAWAPRVAWGEPIHLGFIQCVFPSSILLAPLTLVLPRWNGVTLYYIGLLLNELVLLFGSYALGRLLFRRKEAALFVALAITGCNVWSVAVDTNSLSLYPAPLCLYFMLRGLRDAKLKPVLIGATLLAFTSFVGGATYVSFFRGFACGLLALSAACELRGNWGGLAKSLRRKDLIWVGLALLAVVIPALYLLSHGMPSIVTSVREADGTLNYDTYLHFGADPELDNFSGLGTGLFNAHDITAYAGALIPPFVVFGLLFGFGFLQVSFLIAACTLFLFYLGEGSFVAPWVYYLPGGGLLKNIGYNTVPYIKFCLVILAGYGFDGWLEGIRSADRKRANRCCSSLFLLLIGFLAFYFVSLRYFGHRHVPEFQASRQALIALVLGLAGVLVLRLRLNPEARNGAIGYALILITVADLYSYRSTVTHQNMPIVSRQAWSLFGRQRLQFNPKRVEDAFDARPFQLFAPYLMPALTSESYDLKKARRDFERCLDESGRACAGYEGGKLGMQYYLMESTLGVDLCFSMGNSLYATPDVARLMRPFDLNYGVIYRLGTPSFRLPPGVKWALGCGTEKLGVYPKLELVQERDQALRLIQDGKDRDFLVAAHEDIPKEIEAESGSLRAFDPRTPNSRVPASISVTDFGFNHLELDVTAPLKQKEYWLYYADAWSPDWKAWVNGAPSRIVKADVAFKAVPIPPGRSHVALRYEHRFDAFLSILIFLGSLGMFVSIAIWAVGLMREFPILPARALAGPGSGDRSSPARSGDSPRSPLPRGSGP